MKRLIIVFTLLIIILTTACQKDEIKPSKPDPNTNIIDCRKCDGTWDITDSIP